MPGATPDPAEERAFPWWVLVVVATVVAYLPALRAGFVWDDNAHVTPAELRSWGGLGRIWFEPGATQQFYPVLYSWFWLQHFLWGDAPAGYHLVSVLLHAAAACLVGWNLRRLQIPGAWLAAALFALHPVHVESVAWISEQKNTLSAVFALLAMGVFWRFHATRACGAYFLATAFFAAALASKTVTATVPAGLLVLLWWRNGGLEWRRDFAPLAPWLILGVVAGVFTVMVERHHVGATGVEFDLTLLQRCLLAGRAVCFYAGKLFWPANLIFIYPRWEISTAGIAWTVYLCGVLAVTAVFWRWRHTRRGPLAAWLFFVGTLFPALGFFDVYPFLYSFVADHFQYFASLGLLTLLAAAIALWWRRVSPPQRWILNGAVALVLATLATLTWRQSRTYHDARTLYTAVIARNPGCWMAHFNLGNLLRESGEIDRAIQHYERALQANARLPDAHSNLGVALQARGRVDEAVAHYEEALRIDPNYFYAQNQLGVVLSQQRKFAEALAHHQAALRLNPGRPQTHAYLGNAFRNLGQLEQSAAHYEEALRLDPRFVTAHLGLGNTRREQQRLADAQRAYERVLELEPNHAGAHNNLGTVLLMNGKTPEAIRHFEEALRLNPASSEAQRNLAAALEIARR